MKYKLSINKSNYVMNETRPKVEKSIYDTPTLVDRNNPMWVVHNGQMEDNTHIMLSGFKNFIIKKRS